MQRPQLTLLIMASVTLETACVTLVPLVPGADQVRLTQNAAIVANCKLAGEIHVPRNPETNTVSMADAERQFRNQVVSLGGNAGLVTSGLVAIPNDGIAYQCPESSSPSPSAAGANEALAADHTRPAAGADEAPAADRTRLEHTTYHTVAVDGINIFYREAGSPSLPTVVLLHGAASSSFMFRDLIPRLAPDFHVIAPDYPGYGYSDAPPPERYRYTFDHLAQNIDALLAKLGAQRYILYMHDYGGPVGMRIATTHPERVAGLIFQDANAYAEGLSPAWRAQMENQIKDVLAHKQMPVQVHKEPQSSLDQTLKGVRRAYEEGAHNPETMTPDGYTFDTFMDSRPGQDVLQNALGDDYYTNLMLYPAWQKWLRLTQPRTLLLWGEGDRIFPRAAAEAYKKDLPRVRLVFFPGGHNLLEEYAPEAAREIIATFSGTAASTGAK
jgi:pimeloyl-ACP methyl ester carboxylesterase